MNINITSGWALQYASQDLQSDRRLKTIASIHNNEERAKVCDEYLRQLPPLKLRGNKTRFFCEPKPVSSNGGLESLDSNDVSVAASSSSSRKGKGPA